MTSKTKGEKRDMLKRERERRDYSLEFKLKRVLIYTVFRFVTYFAHQCKKCSVSIHAIFAVSLGRMSSVKPKLSYITFLLVK